MMAGTSTSYSPHDIPTYPPTPSKPAQPQLEEIRGIPAPPIPPISRPTIVRIVIKPFPHSSEITDAYRYRVSVNQPISSSSFPTRGLYFMDNYRALKRVPCAFGWTELVGLGIITSGGRVIRDLELYERTSHPLFRLLQDSYVASCVVLSCVCYGYSDAKSKEENIAGTISLACLAWWLLNVVAIKLNGMLAIPILIGEPVDAVDVENAGSQIYSGLRLESILMVFALIFYFIKSHIMPS